MTEFTRTYRYRLYPTRAQSDALTAQLGFACDLYNAGLEQRREWWRRGRSVNYNDQCKQLTELRQAGLGLEGMTAQVQQGALRRLDRAFEAFFRRVKAGEKPGYPRFRSKSRYDTLAWNLGPGGSGAALVERRLRLQGVGHVKVKWHRPLPANCRLRTVSVTRHGNRWFAAFALSYQAEVPENTGPAVGMDLRVVNSYATLSTGERLVGPHPARAGARRVRRHQRMVSRRKKGSNRRRKAVRLLARQREREAARRLDHAHKLARKLVDEHSLIAVEKLDILQMTRSTARTSGDSVPRSGWPKSRLNREVLDQAWGSFREILRFKAEEAGTVVVEVDPKNTSRTCHECGVIDARSVRANTEFVCTSCGHRADAGRNAALNIVRAGQALQDTTVEDVPRAVS